MVGHVAMGTAGATRTKAAGSRAGAARTSGARRPAARGGRARGGILGMPTSAKCAEQRGLLRARRHSRTSSRRSRRHKNLRQRSNPRPQEVVRTGCGDGRHSAQPVSLWQSLHELGGSTSRQGRRGLRHGHRHGGRIAHDVCGPPRGIRCGGLAADSPHPFWRTTPGAPRQSWTRCYPRKVEPMWRSSRRKQKD